MKKILFILFVTLCVTACCNNEIALPENSEVMSEIQLKYHTYQQQMQGNIEQMLDVLSPVNSRSEDSMVSPVEAFVDCLSKLPPETVDSLYEIYCTPEVKLQYEAYEEAVVEVLVANSSLEEVSNLYSFRDAYIESGGNNMKMIEGFSRNASPMIRDCMIGSAAAIDAYMGVTTQSLDGNSYCFGLLILEISKSALSDAAVTVAGKAALAMIGSVPGADVVGGLILAGLGLYEAIELAHDYNQCCLTHLS